MLLVALLATPAHAQSPSPAAPSAVARPIDPGDLRRHIYVMEGALMRAVSFGAQNLNRELRSAAPEMMALSGEPQARGVYLEGYGVYFDVSVPVLNQMVMWSLRTMLGHDAAGTTAAVNELKEHVRGEKNAANRRSLEQAIAAIESQLTPLAAPTPASNPFAPSRPLSGSVTAASVAPDVAERATESSPAVRIDRKYFQDPNAVNHAYTLAVQNALIDAMLDYALPMAIAPGESLTVAARDNTHRDTLAPPDPYEETVTFLYSIKGADLVSYRTGAIDKVETRRRIQIRQY